MKVAIAGADSGVTVRLQRSRSSRQEYCSDRLTVMYSSYHPTKNTFVDGLRGVGTLNFKTQRYVAPIDAFARDDRDGRQLFASLAGGYEYRNKGFLLSPYLRLDYTSDRLSQSTESGADQYALRDRRASADGAVHRFASRDRSRRTV